MTCKDCVHEEVCDQSSRRMWSAMAGETECSDFKNKADFVEVRCKDCIYAEELDKHCEISRTAYKHCALWRGDETRNVWHKYKKYYRDYSIVEADGFCSDGRRRDS